MHGLCPKWRKASLPSALVAVLLTLSSCAKHSNAPAEIGDDTATRTLTRPAPESVSLTGILIDAEFGPWQSQFASTRTLYAHEMNVMRDAVGSATPIVSSYDDLQRHLLGNIFASDTRPDIVLSSLYRTFQHVSGVPLDPRYEDSRFDIVRQGFSEQCRGAVGDYQRLLASTFMSRNDNVREVLKHSQSSGVATSYELACLTALDDVPLNVRQVVGVLVFGTSPFCSATIIGEDRVITSRHCFVDPSTGTGLTYLEHWKDGNISFVPAVPQNSRRSFKVQEPSADDLAAITGAFEPQLDYWVVRTTRRMQFTANYDEATSDVTQYPITAWLVGSNINLEDIGHERTPLGFIRRAAPTACAVLERTAAGCLYHTCQSSPSTSGAGILVPSREGAVRLVGVHKGTIGEAMGCEVAPPTSFRVNLAITDLSL